MKSSSLIARHMLVLMAISTVRIVPSVSAAGLIRIILLMKAMSIVRILRLQRIAAMNDDIYRSGGDK